MNKAKEFIGQLKPQKKQKPFDMGIKGFKKLLKQNTTLNRADKHRAVVAYKARIAERLQEVADQFEKGVDNDGKV